eukprot:SAG31_NODE_178_length_21247_cov_11.492009_18_plen_87_part_00
MAWAVVARAVAWAVVRAVAWAVAWWLRRKDDMVYCKNETVGTGPPTGTAGTALYPDPDTAGISRIGACYACELVLRSALRRYYHST